MKSNKKFYKKKGTLPQTTACRENRQQTEDGRERQTTPPHYFNRTVPTSTEPKRRKPVQPRRPPRASNQINSTGPTLHKAEPYTEGNYDPARQRKSQGPSTPKINRTRDECNKCVNTHTKTPPTNTTEKRKYHQMKDNIPREEKRHNTAKIKEYPRLTYYQHKGINPIKI
jgi:hypothetical protein